MPYEYDGSLILSDLSKNVNIPLSTVNYIVGILFNMITNLVYIYLLWPNSTSNMINYSYIAITQTLIAYFVFGWHGLMLFSLAISIFPIFRGYLFLKGKRRSLLEREVAIKKDEDDDNDKEQKTDKKSTFQIVHQFAHAINVILLAVTALTFLDKKSRHNATRDMHYSYVMARLFQKFTSYFYAVADGFKDADEFDDKYQKVRKQNRIDRPKLRFSSYIAYILCNTMGGDLIFYNQFSTLSARSKKEEQRVIKPMAKKAVYALITAAICGFIGQRVTIHYPAIRLEDENFLSTNSWLYNCFYCWISVYVGFRCTIYFMWNLMRANAYILGIETDKDDLWGNLTATNMIVVMNTWNKLVSKWLKLICFEQFESGHYQRKFFLSFMISLIWHGVGPNSIVTFTLWSFASFATRKFRKSSIYRQIQEFIRKPNSQISSICFYVYYFISWVMAQFGVCYFTTAYGLKTIGGIFNFLYYTRFISILPLCLALLLK